MAPALTLSREALGNKRYKYTVAVARRADATYELLVSAVGLPGEHGMPEPCPDKRPFVADDLDGLDVKASAFLAEWQQAQPAFSKQILCCKIVVRNAIARARKKLATLSG